MGAAYNTISVYFPDVLVVAVYFPDVLVIAVYFFKLSFQYDVTKSADKSQGESNQRIIS